MEYTELSDYPLRAGSFTTWTPTATAEAWRDDDRALSYTHEAHLADHRPGSWIGGVMRLPGPLDRDVLSRALGAWVARHEALRTAVIEAEAEGAEPGRWRRRTCRPDGVRVEPGEPQRLADGDAAHDAISAHFGTVRPTAWPHLTFATVEEDEGGYVLAFGADHSIMDAFSQLLWFREIHDLIERAARGEEQESLVGQTAPEVVGSFIDYSVRERRAGEALHLQSPDLTRWRDYLRSTTPDDPQGPGPLLYPSYPVRHDDLPGDGRPDASVSTTLGSAEDAAVISTVCRAVGTSFQSAFLAAVARGVRRQSGIDELRFIQPVHTRTEAADATAIGWYVGLCPVHIDLTGDPSSLELIRRCHTAVDLARDLAHRPAARVAQLLELQNGPRFAISFVDTRRVPGADQWPDWDARTLRSQESGEGAVHVWLVRGDEGLSVSTRYPDSSSAHATATELLATVRTVISEMADEARAAIGAPATVAS